MLQQARDARERERAQVQVGANGEAVDSTEIGDETIMEDAAMGSHEGGLGSKLVVIHCGSQNLRVGLGSDALPKTIPMVIARKWKENEAEEGDGEPAPKRIKIDGEVPEKTPDKWFGEDVRSQV